MPFTSSYKQILPILNSSINTLAGNKKILFPFVIIAFVQLLCLEILYFANRYPLNIFFSPIISKLWSEEFLHYPMNFILLPKLFQYAQIPTYIFLSSFFIAVAIAMIYQLEQGHALKTGRIMKEVASQYVHIIVVSLISFLVLLIFLKLYGLAFNRAWVIRSQEGLYFLIKQFIIEGGPFLNLISSIVVSTLFAYAVPIVVIEKKKALEALFLNFKMLFRSFFITLALIFLPSLLFIPILLLRSSIRFYVMIPELTLIALIGSVFVSMVIDAIVYTALTTNYLLAKENG